MRIFLFRAAAVGGLEVLVISTSDSLPTEESEENSISSSAGLCSSAGAADSLSGSPSGTGAGDQYSKTLACSKYELCHNPTGAVGKQKKIEETVKKSTWHSQENLWRWFASSV